MNTKQKRQLGIVAADGDYEMSKHYNFDHRKKDRIYRSTGGVCFYCAVKLENEDILDEGGKPITVRHHWNVDHKTPISRGGTNDENNLAPACITCNADKGTMTAEEFMAVKR